MPAEAFDLNEFSDAVRSGNVDRVLDFFSEGVEFHAQELPAPLRGTRSLRPLLAAALPVLEDFQLEERFGAREGEKVAKLVQARGAYREDLRLPGGPTLPIGGKRFDVQAALFLRLDEEGKVEWLARVRDNWEVMRQLGIKPEEMEALTREVEATAGR